MLVTLAIPLALGFGVKLEPAAADPRIVTVEALLTGPSHADLFRRPSAAAVDPGGRYLVVADRGGQRLVLFDGQGRTRGLLPVGPTEPGGPAAEPSALALDARGRLYVVDDLAGAVQVLTSRGSLLATIRGPEGPDGPVARQPRSVAVGKSGRVYVLFAGESPLLHSELPGGRSPEAHDIRSGVKSFVSPVSLAVSPDEELLALTDPQADLQIQVRARDGELVAAFGEHGEGKDTFSLATHVTFGPRGTLWITDMLRHSISVFDLQGRLLGRVGGFGRAPGQFRYPVGAVFLDDTHLVVVEKGGHRCQILEVQMDPPDRDTGVRLSLGPRSTPPPSSTSRT